MFNLSSYFVKIKKTFIIWRKLRKKENIFSSRWKLSVNRLINSDKYDILILVRNEKHIEGHPKKTNGGYDNDSKQCRSLSIVGGKLWLFFNLFYLIRKSKITLPKTGIFAPDLRHFLVFFDKKIIFHRLRFGNVRGI